MATWDHWSDRATTVHHRATELARRTGREDTTISMSFGRIGPDGAVWEETGSRVATPVHLMLAAAESPGPVAELVRQGAARPLIDAAGLTQSPGPSGVSADVHYGQAWGSAQRWAEELSQLLEPEHLIAVLVEQDRPEVRSTLERAGVDPGEIKRAALGAIGLGAETAIPLQRLPPAGMGGVPPLPIEQLPAEAWATLRSRQQRLPLHRVRRTAHWYALLANEHQVADRLLGGHNLTPDQRQSLIVHHRHGVEALLAEAAPSVQAQILSKHSQPRRTRTVRLRRYRRLRRLSGMLDLFAGWGVWFSNRRAGMLRRWYRLTVPRH
ncbi:MAG: Clp protease N-terminal domain-containing protein [Acidimicrobiales bacterium]